MLDWKLKMPNEELQSRIKKEFEKILKIDLNNLEKDKKFLKIIENVEWRGAGLVVYKYWLSDYAKN